MANDNRRIHLYLPDNYDQSDERYAVLYMFDGHNLFFDQDATFGKSLGLKEFLDAWWKRLIVVGIECAKEDWTRVREYCPYDVQSNYYGAIPGLGHQTFEWVAEKLKPYIDANYRTCPSREATAIAGYSMGGMMSLYGVLKFNQVFSKAAVISPAIQPAMEQFRREIAEDNLNPDSRTVKDGYVEKALGECEVGAKYQFMRNGYFCKDRDSTEEMPVFNRTVALRDGFKIQK